MLPFFCSPFSDVLVLYLLLFLQFYVFKTSPFTELREDALQTSLNPHLRLMASDGYFTE